MVSVLNTLPFIQIPISAEMSCSETPSTCVNDWVIPIMTNRLWTVGHDNLLNRMTQAGSHHLVNRLIQLKPPAGHASRVGWPTRSDASGGVGLITLRTTIGWGGWAIQPTQPLVYKKPRYLTWAVFIQISLGAIPLFTRPSLETYLITYFIKGRILDTDTLINPSFPDIAVISHHYPGMCASLQ